MPEEVEEGSVAPEAVAVERAFGEVNRRRILSDYLRTAGPVTPENAWMHVYRLLLWINPTISLAHCYESDKCQPHKAWYSRSLAVHAWLAERFSVPPAELREHVDRLFRTALPDLVRVEVEARRAAAVKHLAPYADMEMPLPGDDPELIGLVLDVLGPELRRPELDASAALDLVERVYAHFARENKRKNLLGRGFEDTLAALVGELPGHERWSIGTRVSLSDIPGFNPQGTLLKRTEVDLALWEPGSHGRRLLVSAKWSVRADRERQFDSDFEDYSKASSGGRFEYILITNEFDAARLDAACGKVHGRDYLFNQVVHVQPESVLIAYGPEIGSRTGERPPRAVERLGRRKSRSLPGHLANGRLLSLADWLARTVQE